ncbi:hypothetical protein C0Q70_20711 [Pomacea canaliculata]|uniref:Uncharacterized protein n=1 Tax=Pomacea canaliculata TaxID=400727 RepID=A0A2T7NGD5_POMCA|nr:hypothetical protein C0Q70_20711 [Pomacea canaliculata]
MDDVRQARCWTGREEWKEAENEGKLNKSKEEPKEKKDDSRRLEIAAAGLMTRLAIRLRRSGSGGTFAILPFLLAFRRDGVSRSVSPFPADHVGVVGGAAVGRGRARWSRRTPGSKLLQSATRGCWECSPYSRAGSTCTTWHQS